MPLRYCGLSYILISIALSATQVSDIWYLSSIKLSLLLHRELVPGGKAAEQAAMLLSMPLSQHHLPCAHFDGAVASELESTPSPVDENAAEYPVGRSCSPDEN